MYKVIYNMYQIQIFLLSYLQEYLYRTVQRSQYLSFPIVFTNFVYYLHQCYLQNLPYKIIRNKWM
jgi:hypothetical protein